MSCFKKLLPLLFMILSLQFPASAMMNIDTEGAGKAAAAMLEPIIKPIAEELVRSLAQKLADAIDGISKNQMCRLNCKTFAKSTCSHRTISTCLHHCAQTIDVGGGYHLSIRFLEKKATKRKDATTWDLRRCVQLGIAQDKLKEQKGKEAKIFKGEKLDSKTIAIYGKENYDTAVQLIAKIVEFDRIALHNGDLPQYKNLTMSKAEFAKQAKKAATQLRANLQKYIEEGNFGPQVGVP